RPLFRDPPSGLSPRPPGRRRPGAPTTSTLEDIPGVGPKRRQALLKYLGGLQEVKKAGVDELAKVPGISQELAQSIHDALHSL
ncbi:helix-hairpin-helix domain-containing protein, partial [Aeromonas caviae]